MAPFIPEGLVNPDLNLFFALVLGIGFGFVLEQAGFSSSRKLAGVFYGYDFVVLRVFFTAGITAMVGLLFLGFMGWVDMSLIYINPTYLYSAIVGGAIMGVGFILGGYCPGTSIVAATVGKIDAMLFLVGAMVGIFIFGHFYQEWEPLYMGNFLGSPFIYETLGIPKAWFALMMALMAVVAFAITQKIEDNVNKTPVEFIKQRPSYVLQGGLLILAMILFIFMPAQRKSHGSEVPADELLMMLQQDDRFVDIEETTFKIMNPDSDFILIDVRQPEDFEKFALPGAVNITINEITGRTYRKFFSNSGGKKVFYGYGESAADMAWAVARRAGYEGIYVMEGGLNGMFDTLFKGQGNPVDSLNMDENFSQRFLSKAKEYFMNGGGIEKKNSSPVPVTKIIEISTPKGAGGC